MTIIQLTKGLFFNVDIDEGSPELRKVQRIDCGVGYADGRKVQRTITFIVGGYGPNVSDETVRSLTDAGWTVCLVPDMVSH